MTTETTAVHGGRLVARRLAAHGVTKLFTLSGGHLFSVYDGCREEGIDIVDVRHESAPRSPPRAGRRSRATPGVCALTAGPGVTNGMSALGSALQNHSPMLVLGGRAPGDALGPGLAAGDRPRAVRAAAHALRRDGRLDRRDPGARRRGVGRRGAPALRPGVRRPAARPRVHGGRRRARRRGARARARRRRCPTSPARSRCSSRRGAAGDHGRHEPLLGPRRGRAARAGRGARDPGLPQRPRARVHPRRPRAVLLARAQRPRSRAPTSRSSSACRWTSGSASASRSARTRRSS